MSLPSASSHFMRPLGRRSRRLLSAMLWNGLAAACARGFPVLGMLITARVLGREAFGELGIIYQTTTTLQVFAVLGLGTTATTFVASWLQAEPERIPRIMVLCYGVTTLAGGLFAIGFTFGADWIAAMVLAAPALADELRLGGLLAFLVALGAVQNSMLIGFKAFSDMALANFLGGVATAGLIATGAHVAGVAGALYGFGIALVLRGLLNSLLIRRALRRHGLRMRFSLPRAELPLLWSFSLPSVLTTALWALGTWIASALLVRQPDGLAEMGLFAAAKQWFSALMFVPGVLTQVLLPTYAERLAGNRPVEAGSLALRSAFILLLCFAPLVGLLMVISPWIASLYGPEFANGGAVFAVAFAAAGVMAPYGALTNYLVARQRMWSRFAISLLWSVVLLGAAAILVKWGAIGVACATLIAYVTRVIVTYVYARHLAKLTSEISAGPPAAKGRAAREKEAKAHSP
jgi:O-antigen/teichoic acid export membrane protein